VLVTRYGLALLGRQTMKADEPILHTKLNAQEIAYGTHEAAIYSYEERNYALSIAYQKWSARWYEIAMMISVAHYYDQY
jgi:hypothetical protein